MIVFSKLLEASITQIFGRILPGMLLVVLVSAISTSISITPLFEAAPNDLIGLVVFLVISWALGEASSALGVIIGVGFNLIRRYVKARWFKEERPTDFDDFEMKSEWRAIKSALPLCQTRGLYHSIWLWVMPQYHGTDSVSDPEARAIMNNFISRNCRSIEFTRDLAQVHFVSGCSSALLVAGGVSIFEPTVGLALTSLLLIGGTLLVFAAFGNLSRLHTQCCVDLYMRLAEADPEFAQVNIEVTRESARRIRKIRSDLFHLREDPGDCDEQGSNAA